MEGNEELARLFAEAAILVANENKEEGDEASEITLEDQLAIRLSRIGMTDYEQKNAKLAFVRKSLELLKAIQQTLLATEENESTDREYLGVRDLRLVHTMLQIIISWGLYPCFQPGVGVPLAKRVKSGYTSHELLARDQEKENDKKPSDMTRELFELTSQLVDMIASSYQSKKTFTTVGAILLTRHLPDLYAALLQLAYGPTMAVSTARQESPSTRAAIPSDPSQIFHQQQKWEAVGLSRTERDKCARMFMWLFDRSDVQRCMESLMLLLGTSPFHPVPLWLQTICGRFLSRILLKPRGVATVLEFTVSDVEQVQLDQLEKISNLVLAVPKQIASVEEYYTIIAPQLVTLLKESVISPHARDSIRQVVTFIIGKMIVNNTSLGISKIVNPIMDPLVTNWAKSIDDIDDSHIDEDDIDDDVLPERELETLLRNLHQVMVGGEPSAILIQSFLKNATSVLYYLYDYTVKSKSGLREMVLDILKTYFRIVDSPEAVGDLKRIVLSKRDLSGDRLAYFAPGPLGGVAMRLRRHPKPLAGNALPLDPGVLVDFVAEATTKQDLCGDFFVFLLNEYSGLQSLASSTDPRLMVLILHLVTGMQEKLGPDILSKPAQIIGFASNVITRYIDNIEGLKHRQSAERAKNEKVDIMNIVSEDDLVEQPTTEDVQEDFASLVMAINLLRAVIHENEDLDSRTTQLLESTVSPLKQLETYRIEELEEPIHELLLMITSFLSMQKMERTKKTGSDNESKEKYRDAMKALQDDLMPVRAHGMAILRDMVLARDPLVSTKDGLSNVLDIFVRLVQDEDSYIYLNAIKGLSALTDIHGNAIIQKLGAIYSDESQKLDNRLRVGEALLQTVQRSGDALSIYANSLVKPLETVLNQRQVNTHLRVSALSILSMACQTCPVALSSMLYTLTDWVLGILEIEKAAEIRRAATVLIISLFRGLASDALYQYPVENLKRTYRTLRYVEETDPDELTRHQARTALADLDVIMRREIFDKKEEGLTKIL